MARPCKRRKVCAHLKSGLFVPEGYSSLSVDNIVIEVDEIEAVRLADLNCEYQEDAAKMMGISRATFSNIINRAHHKIAAALIKGKAIQINCPRLEKNREKI